MAQCEGVGWTSWMVCMNAKVHDIRKINVTI